MAKGRVEIDVTRPAVACLCCRSTGSRGALVAIGEPRGVCPVLTLSICRSCLEQVASAMLYAADAIDDSARPIVHDGHDVQTCDCAACATARSAIGN